MRSRRTPLSSVTFKSSKPDFTNGKAYVLTDLITKVASSFAIVALGVAGWLFQVRTEESRKAIETHNTQERLYLPEIRSLFEAEVVIDDVTSRLLKPKLLSYGYEIKSGWNDEVFWMGDEIKNAAISLFLPDGDVACSLRNPVQRYIGGSQRKSMPLRAATFMLGEMLGELDSLKATGYKGGDAISFSSDYSRLSTGGGLLNLSEISRPAWKIAFDGEQGVKPEYLFGPDLFYFAVDLRSQLAVVSHELIRTHPELGDRYVEIRSEFFKEMRGNSAVHYKGETTSEVTRLSR